MVKSLSDKGYHRTNRFILRWRSWLFITIPIILLPILLMYHFAIEACCAFTMLLTILFWLFDVLPLPGSALLPVALLPLMNVAYPSLISTSYMKDSNVLLFGGLSVAVAVEYSNLHSRIGLKILSWFGTSPRCIFAGFLVPTVLLSMWMNNTTATAMMVPVADAVLKELYPFDKTPLEEPPVTVPPEKSDEAGPRVPDPYKESRGMRHGLMLTISYAASIGGTGTLVGSGSNLIMVEALHIEYRNYEIKISYLCWMLFAIPNMILCCLALWILTQSMYLGCKATFTPNKILTEEQTDLKSSIKQKHTNLGPMSYHEKIVCIIFACLIVAWITREPLFFPGWNSFMPTENFVSDSAAACIFSAILFAFPEYKDNWWKRIDDRTLDIPPPRALTWRAIHARVGWGILFVLGGGFAMGEGCRISGLCFRLSKHFQSLKVVPAPVLCLCVMILANLMTQVTSNSATAATFCPVLIALADGINVHPTYLLLPVVLSCSFAFTLPISTPPNAVAFRRAKMKLGKMILCGGILCCLCIIITFTMIHALGPFVFDMGENPRNRTE